MTTKGIYENAEKWTGAVVLLAWLGETRFRLICLVRTIERCC